MRTKASPVHHGIYSLRGKPGHYLIRIHVPAGVLTNEQLETVAALTEQSGWGSAFFRDLGWTQPFVVGARGRVCAA